MASVGEDSWSAYVQTHYDALQCGSIDGTDTEAHDAAILRALSSQHRPSKHLNNCDLNTILVARLNRDTTDDTLRRHFKRYGNIKSLRIVRNVVTGFSQGYAFVEYAINEDAVTAWKRGHGTVIDGNEVLVEYELQRSLVGWVPRRLGGGFGGKKESGQLRFGCRDRPFHKPINMSSTAVGDDVSGDRNRGRTEGRQKTGYGSSFRREMRPSPMHRQCHRSRSRDRSNSRYTSHRKRSRSRNRNGSFRHY